MGYYTSMSKAVAGMQADSGDSYNESGKRAEVIIEFGQSVVKGNVSAFGVKNPVADVSSIVFDADFVTSNTINLDVNEESISEVTFSSTHVATAELVRAAIAALTGVASCVIDSNDSASRTFIVTTTGIACVVENIVVAAGASQADATLVLASTDIFRGIAVQIHNDTGVYSVDEAVTFKRKGRIWCPVSVTVSEDDPVYIDLSDSAKRLTNVASGNMIVPTAVFRSEDENNIAVIEINIP